VNELYKEVFLVLTGLGGAPAVFSPRFTARLLAVRDEEVLGRGSGRIAPTYKRDGKMYEMKTLRNLLKRDTVKFSNGDIARFIQNTPRIKLQ